MFAYRHLYHAGNFADVFKHMLLTQLICVLQKKEKPIFVLDTHAGVGRYDLSHPWAQKNKEYEFGVSRLFGSTNYPIEVSKYMDFLKEENPSGSLAFYPGSPIIISKLLRMQDRAFCVEANKNDFEVLGEVVAGNRRVTTTLGDGFSSLQSMLPPKERRGLIFMDPAFDQKGEYDRIVSSFATGLRRFATGVYVAWFPLSNEFPVRDFYQKLTALSVKRTISFELDIDDKKFVGQMRSCGLVILNCPYLFEESVYPALRWLCGVFSQQGLATFKTRFLVD
jgi:23S rRNA (adenine2030-N6)-methyltransferase